jgi:hypothetical protein
MEVEERFGLKRRHTYDEIVQWLNSDPKGVAYPSRVAYDTYNSHVYGQLKDSLRTHSEGQDALNAYRHGDNFAPFVPPRPHPFQEAPAGGPAPPPTGDDDDDLMGPPGPGPQSYPDLLQPEPRSTDVVLLNEGMQPPAPPPPPPAPTLVQQAGSSFAQAAGGAAGNVLGTAAGSAAAGAATGLLTRAAAAAGIGAAAGAEAGPAGVLGGAAIGAVGSMISSAVSGAVSRGFQPGGGSTAQPAGPPTTYGPGGLQVRGQQRNQETVNREQRLHNQGSGAPAAQVDFRTLNGTNQQTRPKDRKVSVIAPAQSSRVGLLGGQASGSDRMIVDPAAAQTRPAPNDDFGSTKVPRTADPGPMAAPTYTDLVGKLKQNKAQEVGPVAPSRPRERSPKRGDRRPLGVQREEARNPTGGGVLFPGGDNRKEAMARRGGKMTAPSEAWAKNFKPGFDFTPKKEPERFDISTPPRGSKRAGRNPDIWLYNRKPRPNPGGGNQKLIGGKRKSTADPENPQASRKPPPKPQGRDGNTKHSKTEKRQGNRKG